MIRRPATSTALAVAALLGAFAASGCASPSPERRAAVQKLHLSHAAALERTAREYDAVGNEGMRDYYLRRSQMSLHNGLAAGCDPIDHIAFDLFLKSGVCTRRHR